MAGEAPTTSSDPHAILYLVSELESYRLTGRTVDWHTQFEILARVYPSGSSEILLIVQRMECLAKIVTDQRMHNWLAGRHNSQSLVMNEAVLRAAAIAPMYCDGDGFRFDANDFFQIVLQVVEAGGLA